MGIIELAVRRPVTVTVAVALVILFGLIGLTRVPVQLTPNVDQPVVTITTRWFGADPQEIVREIIEEQEEVLKRVGGVREMTAEARSGEAVIQLRFDVGVDKEAAMNEVRDKLRQVSEYPPDVDEPVVEAIDFASRDYIAWILVRPKSDSPDTDGDGLPDPIASHGTNAAGFGGDIRELGDFFEDEVKPILERAGGIEQVNVLGGLEREMQVKVDLDRLAGQGIGIDQLTTILRQSNQNVTAGTIDEGKRSVSVRVTGQYESAQELSDTVIAYSPTGTPIFVRDVADVELGYKKEIGFVRSRGTPVIAINVVRETGSNVLIAMENLKQAIAFANENIIEPQGWGIEMDQVYDQTEYIDDAVSQASWNLLIGAILAAVVLFLTLRSIGATLVVIVAIPIATVGTFLGMSLLGRSLNVISMAGLTFAVGMGIDNAIVVLENIFRHREMGKDRIRAAVDGAAQVWPAIVAATLTNVAVFLPVVFIQEEAGQLFRDLSIALTISFFFYLFVGPTVIPMLASLLLRRMPVGAAVGERRGSVGARVGGVTQRMSEAFYRFVHFLTRGVMVRLALVAVLVAASLGIAWSLMPPRDYLPSGNQNLLAGFVLPPPGYSVDEYRRMAAQVDQALSPWWSADMSTPEGRQQLAQLQAGYQQALEQFAIPGMRQQIQQREEQLRSAGLGEAEIAGATAQQRAILASMETSPPPPAIDNFFFVAFGGFVFMGASSQDSEVVAPLSGLLNMSLQGIPGTRGFFFQAPIFRTEGFGGGNSVTLKVVGPSNDQVVAASGAVMGKLIEVFNDFPRPDPNNFNIGRPELRIEPDRARAGLAGVPESSIRTMSQVAVDGQVIGDYRYAGRAIDLTVLTSFPREQTFVEHLNDVPMATRDGRVVPLSSVVQMIADTAPQQINRTEEQSSVSFSINLPPGISISEATNLIEAQIEAPLRQAGVIAPSMRLVMTGAANKLEAFTAAFIPGFILAALVTYLLLAALMENWIYPIVIILSVPFAMAGGLVALAMLHAVDPNARLDVLTMLGFIILIGTIINNPILIVYQALNFWRDGMERNEAIARSTQTRVRPIFMAVVTSLASLSPLVIFAGAGSELYRGLGAVIIGGLAVSTILTLLLTPTLLSLMMDFMRLFRTEPDYTQPQGPDEPPVRRLAPHDKQTNGEPHPAEPATA